MQPKHHTNLIKTRSRGRPGASGQAEHQPGLLLRMVEQEAALLGGHLRQAAALGRELEGAGGGLAVMRALAYAANSLRRMRRMQALLARELGDASAERWQREG